MVSAVSTVTTVYPQLERTGAVLSYHPFGYNDMQTKKMAASKELFLGWNTYILLRRNRSEVGVGVGIDIFRLDSELELESHKIRRLSIPV